MAYRLDQLVDRGHAGARERLIHDVVAETGLCPAEVRAELAAIEEHDRRYGPGTIEQAVRHIADDLGLPDAVVWAEVALVTGPSGARR